jgi:glycosyltransferase involved in cell wall biosynthesis
MATRKVLAIKFYLSYKEATGVVNYFVNLVRALQYLPEDQKPQLLLLHTNSAPVEDVKAIGYPFIEYLNVDECAPLSVAKRAVNKLSRKLTGKNRYFAFPGYKADTLLDHYYTDFFPIEYTTRYCWICDFQHRYLPDNFSDQAYQWSEDKISAIVNNREKVLVSSNDSKRDFDKFYYQHTSTVKVLRFASVLPDTGTAFTTYTKYKDKPYFIVSNQFWPHKNHIAVVKAVAELKTKGIEVLVLFTGHLSDRDPEYAGRVRNIISTYQLEQNIHFLGFLDRVDQLQLIRHSVALIQPSLFEGWSTIVEDCKSLNKFLLLSDLRVHREQINSNCLFFNAFEYKELAGHMEATLRAVPVTVPVSQDAAITAFARDIVEVFEL